MRRFPLLASVCKSLTMTEIAIYDMDRTITRGATYTPFLLHAARARAPWRLLLAPLVVLAMLAYVARLIGRGRLKEINQALLLGRRVAPAGLVDVVEGFADRTMAANVLPGALARIAEDRAAGRRLVMATASYRFYASAIAAGLGFDDVIATNTVTDAQGAILARIDGANCYGPEKLRMIEAWLAEQGLARADCRIAFYSDHVSDAPVLAWADAPFAVNAHERLLAVARERGWPILDWRRA
jgi:HAD superfamily hydrolase (TIGR01490 family)